MSGKVEKGDRLARKSGVRYSYRTEWKLPVPPRALRSANVTAIVRLGGQVFCVKRRDDQLHFRKMDIPARSDQWIGGAVVHVGFKQPGARRGSR